MGQKSEQLFNGHDTLGHLSSDNQSFNDMIDIHYEWVQKLCNCSNSSQSW